MIILFVILISAAVMDVLHCRIPNFFILLGLPLGLCYRTFVLMDRSVGEILVSLVLPLILFFPFFAIHALGAGDIKLLMVVGSFLTPNKLLECIFWSCVIGALAGLVRMLYHKNLVERLQYFLKYVKDLATNRKWGGKEIPVYFNHDATPAGRKIRLHFSVPILLGTLIALGGMGV